MNTSVTGTHGQSSGKIPSARSSFLEFLAHSWESAVSATAVSSDAHHNAASDGVFASRRRSYPGRISGVVRRRNSSK